MEGNFRSKPSQGYSDAVSSGTRRKFLVKFRASSPRDIQEPSAIPEANVTRCVQPKLEVNLFKSGYNSQCNGTLPRGGGLGFRYYVLGENLDYIRHIVRHSDLKETLTYIGLFDKENSFFIQGYGTCAAKLVT